MNHKEAVKFVRNLTTEVFENCNERALEKYYAPDVIGHYGEETITFEDISTRVAYMKKRYRYLKYHITELIVIDDGNLIVYRVRQTGYDTYYKQLFSVDTVGIYRMRNGLISELWLMVNIPLDYFAKPEDFSSTGVPLEKITVDEVARRDFQLMLQDIHRLQDNTFVELSEREHDCLFYFLKGLTAKEIAKMLDLSHRTIEDYLMGIRQKYDCTSKRELRKKVFSAVEEKGG